MCQFLVIIICTEDSLAFEQHHTYVYRQLVWVNSLSNSDIVTRKLKNAVAGREVMKQAMSNT